VTQALESHDRITIERGEIAGIPPEEWDNVIIATGPLTSETLAKEIQELTGEDELAFFDAIAPIVHRDSIDFSKAWFQSRYDKAGIHGTDKDYINCPMNRDEYYAFVDALLAAEKTTFKDWERNTPYFEGCMPVEVMAERGPETLRYGPMKPVGLTDPRTGEQPYAVVQLRQDNAYGTLYNMVGFQTKTRYRAQAAVFRMIPGLEDATFVRLGGLHRNTFINAPRLLNRDLSLKAAPRLRFAGQITGCEGYVESAALGLLAGRMAAWQVHGMEAPCPPRQTAIGALLHHVTGDADPATFQPMNINFGLFPPLETKVKKKERKPALARRALTTLDDWLDGTFPEAA
jgi:methylenetetrahydrofolate--tRNA-(uracil-5-)-methyltransferase